MEWPPCVFAKRQGQGEWKSMVNNTEFNMKFHKRLMCQKLGPQLVVLMKGDWFHQWVNPLLSSQLNGLFIIRQSLIKSRSKEVCSWRVLCNPGPFLLFSWLFAYLTTSPEAMEPADSEVKPLKLWGKLSPLLRVVFLRGFVTETEIWLIHTATHTEDKETQGQQRWSQDRGRRSQKRRGNMRLRGHLSQ